MITREEAVKYFERHIDLYCVTGICREAEEVAIEALKQEPCEDCISRQGVAEVLLKYAHSTEGKAFAEFLVSQINALPSVVRENRTATWWVRETYPLECHSWECSECKEVVFEKSNYCPNCGAHMKGDTE